MTRTRTRAWQLALKWTKYWLLTLFQYSKFPSWLQLLCGIWFFILTSFFMKARLVAVSLDGKKNCFFFHFWKKFLTWFKKGDDLSDFMEYGKLTPDVCRNRPHRSCFWANFLLLLMLKDSVSCFSPNNKSLCLINQGPVNIVNSN